MLLPALIEIVCAAGSVPPVTYVKDNDTGDGVRTELCAAAIRVARKN